MLMADVAIWTALFVGLMVVLPAVWLLFGALWPSALGRAQARIPTRPVATFLAGLGVGGLLFLLGAALVSVNAAPLALVIFALSLGGSFLGVSALARHVGSRLSSPAEPGWKAHLRGSIVLALSFLVPLLGWLVIFPVALVLGLGAATLALFRRPPAAVIPAAPLVVREPERVEVGA